MTVIDIGDDFKWFFGLMALILILIFKTDTDVIIGKAWGEGECSDISVADNCGVASNNSTHCKWRGTKCTGYVKGTGTTAEGNYVPGTCPTGCALAGTDSTDETCTPTSPGECYGSGKSIFNLLNQGVGHYWPFLLGGASFISFIILGKSGSSGYFLFFITLFIAIFFTSYTIYQWASGSEQRAASGGVCFGGREASDQKCVKSVDDNQPCLDDLGAEIEFASCPTECTEIAAKTKIDCEGKTLIFGGTEEDDCGVGGGADATDGTNPICRWIPKGENIPSGEECSILLPISNQFDTKEYQTYRFIYYLTLLTVAGCASVNFSGDEDISKIIIGLPFLIPLITETIAELLNYIKSDEIKSDLSPELLLINFMRGGHSGEKGGDNRTRDQMPKFNDNRWLTEIGGELNVAFFNPHFMITMIIYIIAILLLVVYSQGFYGNSPSNTPIYITIGLMIFFPFLMKYIFIQKCSINEVSDNLPDGILCSAKEREKGGNPSPCNPEKQNDFLKEWTPSNDDTKGERLERKRSITCIIEKYGGIQTLLCISLIILILIKTNEKKDKTLAFGIMILLTYGLSQTFITADVYSTDI